MKLTATLQISRSGRFRVSLAATYKKFEWWLRLLGGVALYILLLQAFAQFTGEHTVSGITAQGQYATDYLFVDPPLLYYFLGLTVFLFLAPLLLSLTLTKRDVELRSLTIVPPLTIGLLGIFYTAVFIFGFPNLNPPSTTLPIEEDAYLFGFVGGLLLVGVFRLEDRLAVALLGRSTEREALYFEELRVAAPIERVKERFSVPEIRSALRISQVDGDANIGYEMKTPRGFDFIIRLKILKDPQSPHTKTIVKTVIYEKTRYSIHTDSYIVEYARKQAGYIFDLLNNRTPTLSAVITTPLTNNSQDPFVDVVIDDMRGLYLKSQKYSFGDKLKLAAFVGIVALTGLLFAAGLTTYGVLSAAIDVLFALNDLPDVISRRET
jgi:hypothetical protein